MILAVVIIIVVFSSSVSAQGTFQNLDFERTNPVLVTGTPNYPFIATADSAFPNWTVTIGGVQQTEVGYNFLSTGVPMVSLINIAHGAIDGNYSALLTASFPGAVTIAQSGTIPLGTQSLLFEAQPGRGAFDVFIGNESVPFFAVGSGANYTLYGANISAWAGDTEQITFSALQSDNGLNNWVLDDISFSQNAVPEPSPFLLLAIGGTMAGLYRRFRMRAK